MRRQNGARNAAQLAGCVAPIRLKGRKGGGGVGKPTLKTRAGRVVIDTSLTVTTMKNLSM